MLICHKRNFSASKKDTSKITRIAIIRALCMVIIEDKINFPNPRKLFSKSITFKKFPYIFILCGLRRFNRYKVDRDYINSFF